MSDLIAENQTLPPGAIEVLPPHGFVKVQAVNASDLDVVNAARVSFAKESDWLNPPCEDNQYMGELFGGDKKLVEFLLKGRHGTPFEHNFFKFHIRAPIFVFREWHRHRIGVSINEESARYSPLQGDFYTPQTEDIREQIGKPGSYEYRRIEEEWVAKQVQDNLDRTYETCYKMYQTLLGRGIAKEVARLCLPVGIYSQMVWSCNARSLMAFLSLRNSPNAQLEIRKYAEALEDIFAEHMPVTHAAFVANERIAP